MSGTGGAGAGLRALTPLLARAGGHDPCAFGEPVRLIPVSGGSINRVYRVDTSAGRALLFKWLPEAPPGFFAAERTGLEALRGAGPVVVPEVYAASDEGILMEWLEPSPGQEEAAAEELGRGLAAIHRRASQAFGFPSDNFTGLLPQSNAFSPSWTEFYRDQRLLPQLERARELGRLGPERGRLAARLLERLDRWIDEGEVVPSLVHGDLWSGNWIASVKGPALIDPAAYYGDREVDLAMARLFGGFPKAFWTAYAECWPPRAGWEERLPLYQLYYLLIHLNIFGESYGPAVDRILRRYAG